MLGTFPVLNLLYNFHWIVPGEAARSAQPYLGFWQTFLVKNGIRALINLRGRHPTWGWWLREDRVCRRNGIAHYDAALNSRHLPTREMLMDLFNAFDAAPRPFLIKCSGGQDRTSFASALYLVHSRGWQALESARAQHARFPYLHFPKREQRWLIRFLDHVQERGGNAPLAAWVRDDYDQGRFAEWLKAKGLGDSYKGQFPPR